MVRALSRLFKECIRTGRRVRGLGHPPGGCGQSSGAVPGPSHPPFAPTAVDPNKERREAVKRKITQYLRRAEEIFNCHLQRAGGGSSTATVRGWRGAAWAGWPRFCATGKRGWRCGRADKAAPAGLLVCLPDATLRWCRENGRCIKLQSVLACQWLQGSWQLFALPGSRS